MFALIIASKHMRKLKLQIQVSVDGYIADKNGKTDWMTWNWGPEWTWDDELQKDFIALKSTIDTVLLSRKMAEEGFIQHWANVPANSPQYAFSKTIAAAHKVVFTRTLFESPWSDTELAKGKLSEEIGRLKDQPGKDMIVYGGASFVSSLLKENLIDELYLYVNPIVLGKGLEIFTNVTNRMPLTLISSRSYACGIAVHQYALKNKPE
jgi:dihydrofolate reductase